MKKDKLLYSCKTEETLEEYIEYYLKIFKADLFNLFVCGFFVMLPSILNFIENNSISYSIVIPITILLLIICFNKTITKFCIKLSYMFDSKSKNSPLIYNIEFYEDYLIKQGKKSTNKYNYNEIRNIIETDKAIYLQCKPFYQIIVIKKNKENHEIIKFMKKNLNING